MANIPNDNSIDTPITTMYDYKHPSIQEQGRRQL